jgi:hypothetical protein
MKDFYNLDGLINLSNFPWDEVHSGLAKSRKSASIFYQHEGALTQQLKLHLNADYNKLTAEQKVWYRAISGVKPLKGMDVLLSEPRSWEGAWYKIDSAVWWRKNSNAVNFPKLFNWIQNCDVFTETGRVIFFIQLQGQCTPPHIDEDRKKIPAEHANQKEFIWLTPPSNPKKLLIDGVHAGNVVWFNNYIKHETVAEHNVRWSLRIDGKFTSHFKKRLGII